MTKYKELRLQNSSTVISLLSADIFQLARSGIIDECGDHFHIDLDDEHADPDSAIEYLLDAVERARAEQCSDAMQAAPAQAKSEAPAGKPIEISTMKELVEHLQSVGKVVETDFGDTIVDAAGMALHKQSPEKYIKAKAEALLDKHRNGSAVGSAVTPECQAEMDALGAEAKAIGMSVETWMAIVGQVIMSHTLKRVFGQPGRP